jgi:hypothetical protein
MGIIGNGLRVLGANTIVTAFVQSTPPSDTSRLLLENGFNLLQENDSKLLLDLGSTNLLMENGDRLLQENDYRIILDL